MENSSAKGGIHMGRNIQRFRLVRGLSQAALAHQLEEKRSKPVSQQLVSDIEDREEVTDEELLKQIAEILKVSPEAIKSLDFDTAINVIGNTFAEHSEPQFAVHIHNEKVNNAPLEKLFELFEKEKSELKAEIARLKKKLSKK